MINALGLLEVRGLTCGIEAADAMLKAAPVRLLRYTVTKSALITLVVEGDLAACNAALEAGAALAMRKGSLISRKEIGRPDDDTAYLVNELLNKAPGGAARSPRTPAPRKASAPVAASASVTKSAPRAASAPAATPIPPTVSSGDAPLPREAVLAFLAGHKHGYSASAVATHFGVPVVVAQDWLQELLDQGRVRLRNSRYRPAGGATK
ncbi:MAG TPA: BMC domain-containing protein [Pseudomonadales bacterium]|nr:BMC domain-containing protein [Pseudomonadales bacterium]